MSGTRSMNGISFLFPFIVFFSMGSMCIFNFRNAKRIIVMFFSSVEKQILVCYWYCSSDQRCDEGLGRMKGGSRGSLLKWPWNGDDSPG